MRKMFAVLIAAAWAAGTGLVASAAPATTDKPAAEPAAHAPAHAPKKHAAKPAAHQHHVSSKAKKAPKPHNA